MIAFDLNFEYLHDEEWERAQELDRRARNQRASLRRLIRKFQVRTWLWIFNR